jgi:hypothetical protein
MNQIAISVNKICFDLNSQPAFGSGTRQARAPHGGSILKIDYSHGRNCQPGELLKRLKIGSAGDAHRAAAS